MQELSKPARIWRGIRYAALYAFSLPGLILALLILVILWLIQLGTWPRLEAGGIFWSDKEVTAVTRFRDFLRKVPLLGRLVRRERLWGGHTMLGPGIWVLPSLSAQGRSHEVKHVWQLMDCYLATGVLALLLRGLSAWTGLGFSWAAAGVLWACGALVWLASYLGAYLRGKRLYADAMTEWAAYAITNEIKPEHIGRTWEAILPEVKRW